MTAQARRQTRPLTPAEAVRQGRKLIAERQRQARPPAPVAPIAVPTHADGAWPIAAMRSGQCRFACTDDRAPAEAHRFCGAPIALNRGRPTSWCAEHLPRVMGAPGRTAGGMSVAQARATSEAPAAAGDAS